MCCQDDAALDLPPEVIEALAHDRRLRDERGWDWGGEDLPDFFRLARFSRLGDVMAVAGRTGDWGGAVREVVGAAGGDPGVLRVAVGVTRDTGGPVGDGAGDGAGAGDGPGAGAGAGAVSGDGIAVRPGGRRLAVPGVDTPVDLVVEATPGSTVEIDGRPVEVPAGGVVLDGLRVDGTRPTVAIRAAGTSGVDVPAVERSADEGPVVDVPAVDVVDGLPLTLRADDWSRWSVLDPTGGAWFPPDTLQKWDGAHRPFFHAREVTLTVPAVPLRVRCARGPEFAPVDLVVDPAEQAVVGTSLSRTHDPSSSGWYSGDLHVHLNYSGDLVVAPEQAAAMQRGEGLALLDLTAGNLSGPRVYDRELLEHTAGRDLWHDGTHVARAGVEFRNDLLGHVHAHGITSPPARYQTGHPGAEHAHDWPPNAVACADLRERGASVGYAHPVFADTDDMFVIARMPEARELVADAALGLVDSVDLVHCWDPRPTAELYRRLLNCGLRLAATAGSDVFLSFAHGPGVASNPPGWGRCYADLAGAPLSAEAFRAAIRAGRTVATNGPFPTIAVAGHGPGAVVDAGGPLEVRVTVDGPFVGALALVGPDGVVAEGPGPELRATVPGGAPGWLAARAEGGPHPLAPEMPVFAHTSPIYLEVGGAGVARPDDARWCLAFLDRLARHLDEHGRFADDPDTAAAQRADHRDVLDRARAFYRRVG